MKWFDKRYINIYFVSAVIIGAFIFMITSTVIVMKNIGGGKTSADLAFNRIEKQCKREGGQIKLMDAKRPLSAYCTVKGKPVK